MTADASDRDYSVQFIDLPRRAGGDRRTEAIQAAMDVIAERGYEHARFSDVAQRSNLATATLQYYFGSREAMLHEALVTAANIDITDLRRQIAGIDDPLRQLERLVAYALNMENVDKREDAILLEIYRVGLRDTVIQHVASSYDRLWRLPFLEAIQHGVTTGQFSLHEDAEFVAIRLTAMLNGVWLIVLNESGEGFQERYLRAVLDDLYRWVGVSPPAQTNG